MSQMASSSTKNPINAQESRGGAIHVPAECGSICMSTSELRYVDGDHWAAILLDIKELKDQLSQEEQMKMFLSLEQAHLDDDFGDRSSWTPPVHRAPLLYGCSRPSSREEILAALPPKIAVDRYVSRYFNSLELASCKQILRISFCG